MNEPARPERPGRPRRAVRPSGTVGHDEGVLRSVHAAAAPVPPPPVVPVREPRSLPDGPGADPALPVRSLDDGDLGWGGSTDDSNDDRLRQDVPPHW
ncbi:MAG: hypothetical protein KJ792_03210 [Actinobacteria bacterium]|nr:hypothetical protein [Actinomycetota bacterium]MCG2800858.1 hypothetical protein [Cellulomonas sp.]